MIGQVCEEVHEQGLSGALDSKKMGLADWDFHAC